MRRDFEHVKFTIINAFLIGSICISLQDSCLKNSRKIGILVGDGSNYEQWKEAEDLAWAIKQPLGYSSECENVHIELFWTESNHSENFRNKSSWSGRRSQIPSTESGFRNFPPDSISKQGKKFDFRSIRPTPSLGALFGTSVVSPFLTITDWLERIDVVILLGNSPLSICDYMSHRANEELTERISCAILFPSQVDDAYIVSALNTLHAGTHLEIWARGPVEEAQLRSLPILANFRVVLLPWSISDWVVRAAESSTSKAPAGAFIVVLVITRDTAGAALDIGSACAAVSQARDRQPAAWARIRLQVHAASPLGEWAERKAQSLAECAVAGIDVAQHATPAALQLAVRRAGAVLFPSVHSGAALRTAALQALHGGVPLVAVAVPPFSEVAVHEHDALLVAPDKHPGGIHPTSAPVGAGRASAAGLASALLQLADPAAPAHMRMALRRRLTCAQPGLLSARRHAFALHVRHRLTRRAGDAPPMAVSFWPGPHPEHRRTELFRSDALRRHGFAVREATYAEALAPLFAQPPAVAGARRAKAAAVRFAVAAKPRTEFLERLGEAAPGLPAFVWTWDLIDFAHDPGRRPWFDAAARRCRAAFLNEMGREPMWARGGGAVHFVNDGAVLVGDRGAGRRPRRPLVAEGGAQAVFVGTVAAAEEAEPLGRTRLLRAVMDAGTLEREHGHQDALAGTRPPLATRSARTEPLLSRRPLSLSPLLPCSHDP